MSIFEKLEKRINAKGLYTIYKLSHQTNLILDSCQNSDKKKAFLMMSPTYGNIGDQAISYYTAVFIKKNFPDYQLVVVSEDDTFKCINVLKKICKVLLLKQLLLPC